jgi:hypothetical protein
MIRNSDEVVADARPQEDETPAGPVPMDHLDRRRVRQAAYRAQRLYAGPVGAVLFRELLSWEEFGYRLGGDSVILELIEHILTAPGPPVSAEEEVAAA